MLEKTLESPLDCKIKPVHPKGNQSWIFIGRTDAEANTAILWPPYLKNQLNGKPWRWERLKTGAEGNDRGRDGWMASPTQWTWVWINSGSWWWTGRPGMLQSMGLQSQTLMSDWTELRAFTIEPPEICQLQFRFSYPSIGFHGGFCSEISPPVTFDSLCLSLLF